MDVIAMSGGSSDSGTAYLPLLQQADGTLGGSADGSVNDPRIIVMRGGSEDAGAGMLV